MGISQSGAVQDTMHLLLKFLANRVGTFRRIKVTFPTTPKATTTVIQLRNTPLQSHVFKIKH
jgi:hypothetical protein